MMVIKTMTMTNDHDDDDENADDEAFGGPGGSAMATITGFS